MKLESLTNIKGWTLKARVLAFSLVWLIAVSGLHGWLNVNWVAVFNDYLPPAKRKIIVGYIPVTCQLTCPVTDYISKYSQSGEMYLPRMFQGFPELKEALISNKIQAAFIVAPMAVELVAQGVPIKVVYLGHRNGSAVVVSKDGPIHNFGQLDGKTIAIPTRFSDERLLLYRAEQDYGMKPGSIKMVEMAPPDVAGALEAHAIDAFVMGEPFPSQAEMGGYGRILFYADKYWPNYMSCILVVRDDLIKSRPDVVQVLVDGIARSGLWLDQSRPHRIDAADFVGRYYYHQKPELLRWALTKPMSRIRYNLLAPQKADFDEVTNLMLQTGLLKQPIPFSAYTDLQFADHATIETSWKYEPGDAVAK
jgi:NitT/TauT family transport system substrate-binding protein